MSSFSDDTVDENLNSSIGIKTKSKNWADAESSGDDEPNDDGEDSFHKRHNMESESRIAPPSVNEDQRNDTDYVGAFSIFVGNLSFKTTSDTLEYFFTDVGCRVKAVTLHRDPITKKPKGSAIVEFEDESSYHRSFDADHQLLNDRNITVKKTQGTTYRLSSATHGGHSGDARARNDFGRAGATARAGFEGGQQVPRSSSHNSDRRITRDGQGVAGGAEGRGLFHSGFGFRGNNRGGDYGDRGVRRGAGRSDRVGDSEGGGRVETTPSVPVALPTERPKLVLAPRTKPLDHTAANDIPPQKKNIFGVGKPQDALSYEEERRRKLEQQQRSSTTSTQDSNLEANAAAPAAIIEKVEAGSDIPLQPYSKAAPGIETADGHSRSEETCDEKPRYERSERSERHDRNERGRSSSGRGRGGRGGAGDRSRRDEVNVALNSKDRSAHRSVVVTAEYSGREGRGEGGAGKAGDSESGVGRDWGGRIGRGAASEAQHSERSRGAESGAKDFKAGRNTKRTGDATGRGSAGNQKPLRVSSVPASENSSATSDAVPGGELSEKEKFDRAQKSISMRDSRQQEFSSDPGKIKSKNVFSSLIIEEEDDDEDA